jgi:hypothetical protein
MHPDQDESRIALQEQLRKNAEKLVDTYWNIITELAEQLLAKPCMPLSQEEINLGWSTGQFERHMNGDEIVEFFARHNIKAKVVSDGTSYDSTQDVPQYDSLG